MATDRPPTIDPVAAARWERLAPRSPWLHEEVGRRMEDRLQWIKLQPACWADWEPLRGGLDAHALIDRRYPRANCLVAAAEVERTHAALTSIARPWWRRIGAPPLQVGSLPDGAAQMLWANMALHLSADPQSLIGRWHQALAVDGFLMFSCLGPDSLRELRHLYRTMGWPPPAHEFTDMHDWGDMLVAAGFAEPVMDMERITLTWDSPVKLLTELGELGSNLHLARFGSLRGRRWRTEMEAALATGLGGADGRLALTFEIIYGHALRPAPRVKMSGQSAVSLNDMRALLRSDKARRGSPPHGG